jgi:ATP/maltotriose-dependent transcriptional regulator MalT
MARSSAQSRDKKEISFRNTLLEHFDILKKAALLETYIKEDEKKQGAYLIRKFNEIVYGQTDLDWNLLYRTMNDIHDGFYDRLKEIFPVLNESEFRICCLSYEEFSNTEISIVLKYSINTVQAKKTSIRKKLGIKASGNLHDFLDKIIKSDGFANQ